MNKCIYTGEDDSKATFNSAEHILPKCIGGIRCLPKGWVSDKVNNDFSALELNFARNNPIVELRRMFGPDIGRKKHTNRYRVGVFTNAKNTSGPALGYVKNAVPFILNQIVFSDLSEEAVTNHMKVKIFIAPSDKLTHEELIERFFTSIKNYNGCPSFLKDKKIPPNTYILAIQDNRWYLGLSNDENPETIKPVINRAVQKMAAVDPDEIISSSSGIAVSSEHVTANFSISFNYLDCYRVYAKIALNALAFLKGREYILSPEFDAIKNAVLNGKNISKYVYMVEGDNPIIPIFNRFPDKIQFGDQFHSVVFIKKDNRAYGIISLYGSDNPVMVNLSENISKFEMDIYICDWQNQKDYKLIDCVLKICEQNREDDFL